MDPPAFCVQASPVVQTFRSSQGVPGGWVSPTHSPLSSHVVFSVQGFKSSHADPEEIGV